MKVTYNNTQNETITGTLVARHEDYAEPMNEVRRDDGSIAMLKDSEITVVADNPIARVKFTYAMDSGLWIERVDGRRDWLDFDALRAEVGGKELERVRRIALANGMCGMWYNAANGRNVFECGVEVN